MPSKFKPSKQLLKKNKQDSDSDSDSDSESDSDYVYESVTDTGSSYIDESSVESSINKKKKKTHKKSQKKHRHKKYESEESEEEDSEEEESDHILDDNLHLKPDSELLPEKNNTNGLEALDKETHHEESLDVQNAKDGDIVKVDIGNGIVANMKVNDLNKVTQP